MFNKITQSRSDMEFNITAAIVVLLAVFAIAVSTIGAINFANSFKRENSTTTYHIADTASILVNGDHVETYLNGGEQEEQFRLGRACVAGEGRFFGVHGFALDGFVECVKRID